MEADFRRVVEHIFNNWTALKLSVDHCTAGPNSKEVAQQFVDYTAQYCLQEPNVEVDDIEEAMDDILDQEFDTICEDGSTKEIAMLLYKFLELLKQGNSAGFEEEYQKLAINTIPVQTGTHRNESANNVSIVNGSDDDDDDDDDDESETPMEQEPEWVEVKSRRKR